MGTYFPGRITIGGKLPRSKLDEFVEMVDLSGARFDWASDGSFTKEDLLEDLKTETPEPIHLMDGEASFGHFEDLENWLAKNGMSYLVSSDSYCEYEATINGLVNGEPFSVDSNQSGDAVVGMEIVTSALASLKEGDIFAAIATLSAAAKETPEVPPFEIVDDKPARPLRRKRRKS